MSTKQIREMTIEECYMVYNNIKYLNHEEYKHKPFVVPKNIIERIKEYESFKNNKKIERRFEFMNDIETLNTYLFDQLDRLNDDNADIDAEVKRAEAVSKVAGSILKSGELSIRATELKSQYQPIENKDIPKILRIESDD